MSQLKQKPVTKGKGKGRGGGGRGRGGKQASGGDAETELEKAPRLGRKRKMAGQKDEWDGYDPWVEGGEWDQAEWWAGDPAGSAWAYDYEAWVEGEDAKRDLGDKALEKEPKRQPKKPRKNDPEAKNGQEAALEASAVAETASNKKRKTSNGEEPAPKAKANKRKPKQPKAEPLEEPVDPVPTTAKEQRKEIKAFLESVQDFSEENAKDLRTRVPAFRTGECSLNVYWTRRGVKGVGWGWHPAPKRRTSPSLATDPLATIGSTASQQRWKLQRWWFLEWTSYSNE